MAESIYLPEAATKAEKYEAILPQVEALISTETDTYANLANVSAVLKEAFGFFWVGFYLVKEGELVLGPFQGPLACTRIKLGKGVCGTSWEKAETQLVPDVDAFPGHIACSSASKSEIVVPGIKNGEVWIVLDVDSDLLDDFDYTDQEYLEKLMQLVDKYC
ncbi:GAF domain-containing protein, involved in signal transduction [Indibacter alkaliphilus LW1]|uniref:GAF domain-containing protein, involved in signal transduction n=1 Tax=Indibacter alkaliphilus (strain CCUG 57479 / KCTC 22604 / LW1) TaxID=1189612 RepID=S2DCD5_INDAL|nr:GAF domain-containing protein [Indibacter alkaliphilus]EOZ96549.1 GAF domain-containing protein, involved in signal transduction [Indibacter alkaliphilus LW1]